MFFYTFYDKSECFQNGALFMLLDIVFGSAYARPPFTNIEEKACTQFHWYKVSL